MCATARGPTLLPYVETTLAISFYVVLTWATVGLFDQYTRWSCESMHWSICPDRITPVLLDIPFLHTPQVDTTVNFFPPDQTACDHVNSYSRQVWFAVTLVNAKPSLIATFKRLLTYIYIFACPTFCPARVHN